MEVVYHPEVSKKIRTLSLKDNTRIVKIVELFKDKGFHLTALHLKKIKSDLWELRAGRFRLLFGVIHRKAYVVNVFQKQTQKTPKKEIKLSIQRLKDV